MPHLYPFGASGKELTCQCRRHKRRGFDPWIVKIPWRRAWQPTPVSLLEESPWREEPGCSPWDSPGKNTGVDSHFLFQGIFTIQGSNPLAPS